MSTKIASFISKVLSCILERRPEKNIIEVIVKTVESLQSQNNENDRKRGLTLLEAKQFLLTNSEKKTESTNISLYEEKSSPIKLVFLLAGLNNSGKSTLVSVLKGQNNPNCKPSMGFRPISLKYNEMITVKVYDLGGGDKIRGIWNNYYHDVHGVIYVVDSACSQVEFRKTVDVAKSTLGHKFLQGKPLLVISNKVDKSESKPIDFVREKLNLVILEGGMTHILSTSLHPLYGRDCYRGKPDPNIDKALEWLIQKAVSNINELNERIADDSEEIKALRLKKHEEKERRVFKNSLCKAFALNGEQRVDVLKQKEGEEFLAHEIGLSGHLTLPPQGKEICSLVGYQRFALMIVGSMISNRSKQKRSWSWTELLSYVHSVRCELNLSQ